MFIINDLRRMRGAVLKCGFDSRYPLPPSMLSGIIKSEKPVSRGGAEKRRVGKVLLKIQIPSA